MKLSDDLNKNIGNLYCFTGLNLQQKLKNLGVPIGLTWNLKWNTMYLTDIVQSYVYKMDYDRNTGKIGNSIWFLNKTILVKYFIDIVKNSMSS